MVDKRLLSAYRSPGTSAYPALAHRKGDPLAVVEKRIPKGGAS